MDELSWRARLAKSNINILNIDDDRWYYEFMYHPRPGQTKWCKTFHTLDLDGGELNYSHLCNSFSMGSPELIAKNILSEVLKLRKELED